MVMRSRDEYSTYSGHTDAHALAYTHAHMYSYTEADQGAGNERAVRVSCFKSYGQDVLRRVSLHFSPTAWIHTNKGSGGTLLSAWIDHTFLTAASMVLCGSLCQEFWFELASTYRCECARARPVIGAPSRDGAHDAAVGDKYHILATELLFQFTNQPLLNFVKGLQ